jgi:CRISPR/Cas system-associated exonuclease Cas4 (RecB family)
MIKITPSNISDFLFCPYKYWLSKQRPKIVTAKSPEAVLGIALHDAIHRFLYQILNDNERMKNAREKRAEQGKATEYYYQTVGKFLSFCAGFIIESFQGENSTSTRVRDKNPIRWPKEATEKQIADLKEHFLLLGLWMAKKYYLANQGKPGPFLREKLLRYSLFNEISPGVELVGKLDQARRTSEGKVFIVDIKTGFDPFERNLNNAGTVAKIPLVRLYIDYQLSAYWFLYEKCYGESPHKIGFYYLKTSKCYFTNRTSSQMKDLFNMIHWILQAGETENFSPVGMYYNRCRYCDYQDWCEYYKKVEINKPITIKETKITLPSAKILIQDLSEELREINYKQYRLKLIKHR